MAGDISAYRSNPAAAKSSMSSRKRRQRRRELPRVMQFLPWTGYRLHGSEIATPPCAPLCKGPRAPPWSVTLRDLHGNVVTHRLTSARHKRSALRREGQAHRAWQCREWPPVSGGCRDPVSSTPRGCPGADVAQLCGVGYGSFLLRLGSHGRGHSAPVPDRMVVAATEYSGVSRRADRVALGVVDRGGRPGFRDDRLLDTGTRMGACHGAAVRRGRRVSGLALSGIGLAASSANRSVGRSWASSSASDFTLRVSLFSLHFGRMPWMMSHG